MMPSRSTTLWIELQGKSHRVVLKGGEGAGTNAPVTVDGVPFTVDARELSPGVLSLLLTLADGSTRSFACIADPAAGDPAVLIDGLRFTYAVTDPRSIRAAAGGTAADSGPRPLKSPMPGRILRVLVAPGELVEAGQGCVVIEAMKMQNELKAPRFGRIALLNAKIGETVAAGAVLLVVE